MYHCKNCGAPYQTDAAVICVRCGVPKGQGSGFCPNCGRPVNPQGAVCLNCGVPLKPLPPNPCPAAKSKVAAGLLGIFLGHLGIHNFYLGYTAKAVIQLSVSILGYCLFCWRIGEYMVLAMAIWGLVEGIMILAGGIIKDGNGMPLKD